MTRRTAAQVVLTLLLFGFVLVPAALAKGGGKPGRTPVAPLSMTSDVVYWPDTWEPNCITEDDSDVRSFAGSLDGSYSTSYALCGLTDPYSAGGIGLQASATVNGTLTDLSVTSPDGTVTHGVSTGMGVYGVCVVPPYFAATNTSFNPLAGGTWTITLSGQIKSVSWTTRALMANVNFQTLNCPPAQQNIIR